MKNYYIIPLLFAIACVSCSEDNSDSASVTKLEGKWKSQCFSAFSNFNSTDDASIPSSIRLQHIFEKDAYDVTIINYDDNSCSTSGIEINAEDFTAVNSFPIPISFSVGDNILTVDGDIITEINFQYSNGNIKKDVYLMKDSSLYFGQPATECLHITTEETFLLCNEMRPDTINFSVGFALNGEPTVTVPDIFFPSGSPVSTPSNFDISSVTITQVTSLPEEEGTSSPE